MKTEFINELDTDLQRKLLLLKDVPPRDASLKARHRAQYLTQLKHLPAMQNSVGLFAIWPFSVFSRNRFANPNSAGKTMPLSLGKAFCTMALVLVLVSSSIGMTAYAAQSSLPSNPIYPLKLMTEDIRLQLTSNSETKFSLILAYANKRFEEITALQSQGLPVEEPVVTRLQDQFEYALQLASGMPDDQMTQSLEQLRETTQVQLKTMTTLRENAPEDSGAQLERVQEMLEEKQNMAQNGLVDPDTFREDIRDQYQNGDPVADPPGNQNGVGVEDAPGQAGPPVDQPGVGPGQKDPNLEEPNPLPDPGDPGDNGQKGTGPGPGGEQEPGKGAESEPTTPGEEVLSNHKGFYVQYGVVIYPDRSNGRKAKFEGSPLFIP